MGVFYKMEKNIHIGLLLPVMGGCKKIYNLPYIINLINQNYCLYRSTKSTNCYSKRDYIKIYTMELFILNQNIFQLLYSDEEDVFPSFEPLCS